MCSFTRREGSQCCGSHKSPQIRKRDQKRRCGSQLFQTFSAALRRFFRMSCRAGNQQLAEHERNSKAGAARRYDQFHNYGKMIRNGISQDVHVVFLISFLFMRSLKAHSASGAAGKQTNPHSSGDCRGSCADRVVCIEAKVQKATI